MEFLLTLLGSSGFGAITGGFFGWLSKREERENMKIRFEHQVALIKAKSDAAVIVAGIEKEKAVAIGAIEVEKQETLAFTESQKTISSFSEIIKSLIRPAILGVLMYQTYLILVTLENLTGGLAGLPPAEIASLYKIVILSITGLTSVAVGWYFAQRTSKQFDKLLEIHRHKDV